MSNIHSEETVRQFIQEKIASLAKSPLSKDEIDTSANFVASGIIDSMAFVRLLMDTESELEVELDFSELDPSEFLSIDGFAKQVMVSLHGCSSGVN